MLISKLALLGDEAAPATLFLQCERGMEWRCGHSSVIRVCLLSPMAMTECHDDCIPKYSLTVHYLQVHPINSINNLTQ